MATIIFIEWVLTSCPLFGLAVMSTGLTLAQVTPPAERKFSIEAKSSKFQDLIAPDAKLDKVATGFKFTEGPLWDKAGLLYVSDEGQNKIFRVFPDGRTEPFAEIRDPDGNTFDRDGRLITCASQLRVVAAIAADGSYKILADKYQGKKFNSPNERARPRWSALFHRSLAGLAQRRNAGTPVPGDFCRAG